MNVIVHRIAIIVITTISSTNVKAFLVFFSMKTIINNKSNNKIIIK